MQAEAEVLAACHIHSSWSYDGTWQIESLVAAFDSRGYRVVMMTEHDRGFSQSRYSEFRDACARASTDRVYVLPGIEYSDPDNCVHVLVWGEIPFLGEALPTGRLLEAVTAHGGIAVFAHPSRRNAWERFRAEWIEHLSGIELWNRKYDGWAASPRASALLEMSGRTPFVGLDFHARNQMFPLGMALAMTGPLSEPTILEALRHRPAARVFGAPLDARHLQTKLRLLRVAERARRNAASVKRYTRRHLLG